MALRELLKDLGKEGGNHCSELDFISLPEVVGTFNALTFFRLGKLPAEVKKVPDGYKTVQAP